MDICLRTKSFLKECRYIFCLKQLESGKKCELHFQYSLLNPTILLFRTYTQKTLDSRVADDSCNPYNVISCTEPNTLDQYSVFD